MSDSFKIRPITTSDLARILSWRNHPSIRAFMLTQQEISMHEHEQWFIRVQQDARHHLLITERNNEPFGFAQFTLLSKDTADWGLYAAPEAPRGSGRTTGLLALEHAFHTLHLHKVCGQALSFNAASIRLHNALGFRQEGVLRQQYWLNEEYHDLICYGLLSTEWRSPTITDIA